MRTARLMGAVGALTLTSIGMVALAAPAYAADEPNCETTVAQVVDRPDSGDHGDWALDTFTRTTQICYLGAPVEAQEPAVAAPNYHAVVTDSGTFVTVAGNSPGAGTPLPAGVTGTMTGSFTMDFYAPGDFDGYVGDEVIDTETFTGPIGGENPSTGDWVAKHFSGVIQTTGLNNDWTWTYKTCTEQWVNAAEGNSGDITGSPTCPPPATPDLPVTGADVSRVVLIGGVALVVGVVLVAFVARQRRRTE